MNFRFRLIGILFITLWVLGWKTSFAKERAKSYDQSPQHAETDNPNHGPAANAGFNYPQSRLALSMLNTTLGGKDAKTIQALADLDALARELTAARERDDDQQLKNLNARLLPFQKQHGVKTIINRIHKTDAAACLRLMIQLDWLRQDTADKMTASFSVPLETPIDQLGTLGKELAARRDALSASKTPPTEERWMQLYLDACRIRRATRLGPHRNQIRRIVFTKHHDIGGQHYAYTEDVSDSPYNDNNPFPHGGKLCLLEMEGDYGRVRTLLDEPQGLIRDPAVSYDGKRILFARRKSMTKDDYHLYEMTLAGETIRQLTFGKGVADYEPTYLPSGDILFTSTRCQQIIDCWWSDVSNLYTCDADGQYLRRLAFDQAHTNYPTVLSDGRVVYTRWDYNDRGQLFPQPLFQMNPDGTGQTEFYGNNSWFPTSILHARGIPATGKVVCVLAGHHTYQKGKLAIIDPAQGRQEADGVQLIAPVRTTTAVKIDRYGHQGKQFQYPYPLSETTFLVTFSPQGSKKGRDRAEIPFGVYLMTIDGQRELLAADPEISCNQSIPVAPRPIPPIRHSKVDFRKQTGTYFVQDIYHGPGLRGIARGTIKRLRVVALEFRAAGIGYNDNRGPAGQAMVSTPISMKGAWDVKRVLGSAKVYEDGSAAFTVPARTPVYFQALDEKNHVVQTMRSWSTLQPGETFSCVGCHQTQNSTPTTHTALTAALKAGPQPLKPLYDEPLGFSFPRLIQPILNRHCVSCHNRKTVADNTSTISLQGDATPDPASLKAWSDAYKTLAAPKFASWISPQSPPTMLRPYHAGAASSKLIAMLTAGHEDAQLSQQEMDLLACWIDLAVPYAGDYTEGMDPKQIPQYQKFLNKRKRHEAEEAKRIKAMIGNQVRSP